jgi:3-dehydroquinate dehydratase
VAVGVICGLGPAGYVLALEAIKTLVAPKAANRA